MKVDINNKKLYKVLTSDKELVRKYGTQNAKKVQKRLDDLLTAENAKDLPPACRFHQHSGNRKGLFSLDIQHPFRLIIRPTCAYDPADYRSITEVEIYEIMDPH